MKAMEVKIWKQLVEILSCREDLIGIIKPFMENLNNKNMNDSQYNKFHQSLSVDQLNLLHKHNIISEKFYNSLIKRKKKTAKMNMNNNAIKNRIDAILEEDNNLELQRMINQEGFNSIVSLKHHSKKLKR